MRYLKTYILCIAYFRIRLYKHPYIKNRSVITSIKLLPD